MSYKIKTSFAFPIIKINTIIKSTKVEKPSGISYLLLVLINEVKDPDVLLANTLKICGVPKDLYSVFADELQKLINLEILTTNKYDYNKQLFEGYSISNFKFTPKGRKIFLEESIPLGHDEEIKQAVFYNPALNKTYIDDDYYLRSATQSILDEKFFKKINIPSVESLEDFLNSQKGRQIPIKNEEIILDVKIQNEEKGFDTFDFFINIKENDKISFDFSDIRLKEFFEKNYNNKMITEGILLKNKFKFNVLTKYRSKLSDHLPLLNVYPPGDAEMCYSKKSHLNIYKDGYESFNNKLSFLNINILNETDKNSAFIKIVSLKEGYIYIPTYVTLDNDVFGDIKVALLLEKELSNEKIKEIFEKTLNLFTVYDSKKENEYNFKNLIELCKLDKSNEAIFNKINEFINLDTEESILLLEKIKDESVSYPKIYEFIKKRSIELYNKSFEDVNIKNLEDKLILNNWITKMNKLEEIKQLELIFNNIECKKDNDKIIIYKILEKYNFKPENIVVFLKDIPKVLLKSKKIDTNLSNDIKLLFNQLEKLQQLTSIKDLSNYIIKDNINRKQYINTYNSFYKSYNKLDYLKEYLKEEFNELEKYDNLFKTLNEIFQKEEEAALNPKKINKKFLLNIIKTSNVLTSVAYVYIKLSDIAKTVYQHKGDIYEFIDLLYKNEKLTTSEHDLFHKFRMYRNDLEHANIKRVDLSKNELIKITDIIFKLEESKDESSSRN